MAIKLAIQHPSNNRLCQNFWTYDPLSDEDQSVIAAFNNLMAQIVHDKQLPDDLNPIVIIRDALQRPRAFPFVLMADGQTLNPRIESLAFNEVFVSDIPQALRRLDHVVDLVNNLSPSFEETVWSTIENDPPNTVHHVRTLVLILFFAIFLESERAFSILLTPLCDHIAKLPSWSSDFLTKSLSRYPQLILQLVTVVMNGLVRKIRESSESIYKKERFEGLFPFCDFLCRLYEASLDSDAPLKSSVFVCSALNERLHVGNEKSRFGKSRSYLRFPPLIRFAFKRKVFFGLLNRLKQQGRCHASIHRTNLVNDAIQFLNSTSGKKMHKQLKVEFVGEEAIDVGGPMREFIDVTAKALFSPDYSMWKAQKDEMLWFTDNTFESMDVYRTMGKFVGLALFQKVYLPVRFSRLLYHKLIQKKLSVKDVSVLDEDVGSSLRQLVDMREGGGDVRDCYLTFVANVDQFGTTQELPFFDGGEEMEVTNENLDDYIRHYTTWVTETTVKPQYCNFSAGLSEVIPLKFFFMFSADQLDQLISGDDTYDWNALEQNATYQGCNKRSKFVRMFWDVFHHDLTEQQKKEILYFTTSTSRVPIGGLGRLKFEIKAGRNPNDLPTSHTCFSQLVLPPYRTRDEMKEKLNIVIANAQGFGCA